MKTGFTARRRADEFEALVEGRSTRRDASYAQLLTVVDTLRDVPPVQPRTAFTADLRERLMAEAATALAPRPEDRLKLPPRRPARQRRVATAVGGLAIVGATTTMAMAAQSALPGDTLYPLKRAIENAHTGISVGDSEKGATMLANASGRLDEASALSHEGHSDDAAIADTLATFTQQTTMASDLLFADYAENGNESSIVELRDFTGSSMQTLADLDALVPGNARDELRQAAQLLTQIDAQAEQACPTCGGSGITEIPSILARPAGFGGLQVPPASAPAGAPDGSQQAGTAPEVPQVDAGNLPPGSVTAPGPGSTSTAPQPADTDPQDPIKTLTDNLTSAASPTSSPTLPGADEVIGGLEDAVGDATTPLTDGLQP